MILRFSFNLAQAGGLVLWRNAQRTALVIAICAGALSLFVIVPFLYLGALGVVFEGNLLSAAWWNLLSLDLHVAHSSAILLYWLVLTLAIGAVTLLNHFAIQTRTA